MKGLSATTFNSRRNVCRRSNQRRPNECLNNNSKIIITNERNPYEIYLQKISDHNKVYVRPYSNQQSSNILQQKSNLINKSISGQEIAVISLSVVIIFILVSLFLMFIL